MEENTTTAKFNTEVAKEKLKLLVRFTVLFGSDQKNTGKGKDAPNADTRKQSTNYDLRQMNSSDVRERFTEENMNTQKLCMLTATQN